MGGFSPLFLFVGITSLTIIIIKLKREERREEKKERRNKKTYVAAICFWIFFIVYGGIYFSEIYPNLKHYGKHLFFRQVLSIVLYIIPLIFFVLFQFMDPGTITCRNVKNYEKQYPYDDFLWKKHFCKSLNIPAVARSRYDKYTHRRIAKYDHYCAWILNPIGERTMRWFLLFLISCFAVSFYFTIGMIRHIIWTIIRIKHRRARSITEVLLIALKLAMKYDSMCFGSFISLFVITIVIFLFILKAIRLISTNRTTIEDNMLDYDSDKNYNNIYNKGLIQNWKECLFPPKIETHDKVSREEFPEDEYCASK